jgi:hypothetical protein
MLISIPKMPRRYNPIEQHPKFPHLRQERQARQQKQAEQAAEKIELDGYRFDPKLGNQTQLASKLATARTAAKQYRKALGDSVDALLSYLRYDKEAKVLLPAIARQEEPEALLVHLVKKLIEEKIDPDQIFDVIADELTIVDEDDEYLQDTRKRMLYA